MITELTKRQRELEMELLDIKGQIDEERARMSKKVYRCELCGEEYSHDIGWKHWADHHG